MSVVEPGNIIANNVPRDAIIDLADRVRAGTATAHRVISEGTDLDPRRRNRASGMLRFHINEKGFEDVTRFYGGIPLLNGQLPNIELSVHQPYQQFGQVLLGFASATEPGTAPTKNKSRSNAAQLNLDFMQNLGAEPKKSDTLFALLVAYRDWGNPGKIAEIGVGMLASDNTHFVFYERLETFVARYAPARGNNVVPLDPASTRPPLVSLKNPSQPFAPSEKSTHPSQEKSEDV